MFHGGLLELHVRAKQCEHPELWEPTGPKLALVLHSPSAQLLSNASTAPEHTMGTVLSALFLPGARSSPAGPAPSTAILPGEPTVIISLYHRSPSE